MKYSFTGASISPETKTVSVQYFNNIAPIVYPTLSQTLTETLKDKFVSQTSLVVMQRDADMNFEGQITGYTVTPTAIQGDQYASQNRLTITVSVKFTNKNNPELNYNKSFSAYEDFAATEQLVQVESEKTKLIVEKLVDDIFNAAVANW
jgi:hypothetical protein